MRLVYRRKQNAQRLRIVSRQMPLQRAGNVLATRHERQRVIPGQCIVQKCIHRKTRMHRRHHARNGAGHVGAVLGDKGFSHGEGYALKWLKYPYWV